MQKPVRVLIADDHPINRLVFQEIFQHLGCTVHVVEDGGQAMLKAANACFDLICLDRHMPGFSGDEVAALLPSEQFVVARSTDLMDLPARSNSVLAKPLTVASALGVISLARAWRDAGCRIARPPAYRRLRRLAR